MINSNFKKTDSEKTSLLERSHLTGDLPNPKFKIVIPANPHEIDNKISKNNVNVLNNDREFDLEKYYENLKIYQNNLKINKVMEYSNDEKYENPNEKYDNLGQKYGENKNKLLEQDLNKEISFSSNINSYFGFNKITNYFSSTNSLDNNLNNSNKTSSQVLNQYQISENEKNFNEIHYSKNILEPVYSLPKSYWFYKTLVNQKDECNDNLNKNLSYLFVENQQDNAIYKIKKSEENNLSDEDQNWVPFSMHDSECLENAYQNLTTNPDIIVSTNGNRYDCYVKDRYRKSIYWEEKNSLIRRCTWFYKKEGCNKFIPYNENFSILLENIYYDVVMNNKWNKRIQLNSSNQGFLIFYSPISIIHYEVSGNTIKDEWNVSNENLVKLKTVIRELTPEELKFYEVFLYDEEVYPVDHLVFLVHGIGEICDMRFRSIKEVVNDFRKISLTLTKTHFRNQNENIGRTEFIPVLWHDALHGNQTGIDSKLNLITLPSIPKLRSFLNDTVLDALLYTSPVYSQTIMNVVANEINRLYELFLKRNPYFQGTVSLSGHSLGSVILFDLLANQEKELNDDQNINTEKTVTYSCNNLDSGKINITYPKLNFKTACFFALGSPISMFLTLRGVCKLNEDFNLPNCKNVFNIFHPFDPIAYRIEPLINKNYSDIRPVIIPHHKGRKRMHIQIKENILKMSSDFKEKFYSGIKTTWNSVNSIIGTQKTSSVTNELEFQLNEQFSKTYLNQNESYFNQNDLILSENLSNSEKQSENQFERLSQENINLPKLGLLNNGNRIDYVLQEKPIEYFNQYIFALATHACYWVSEDTSLFILKELYKLKGVYIDSCLDKDTVKISPLKANNYFLNYHHSDQVNITTKNKDSVEDISLIIE